MGPAFGAALGDAFNATYAAIQQQKDRQLQAQRLQQAMQIAQMQDQLERDTAHLRADTEMKMPGIQVQAQRQGKLQDWIDAQNRTDDELKRFNADPETQGLPDDVKRPMSLGIKYQGLNLKPIEVPGAGTLLDPLTREPIIKGQPRAPKSLQSKTILVDGKRTEANYNPDDGSYSVGGQTIDPSRIQPPTDPQQAAADAASRAEKRQADSELFQQQQAGRREISEKVEQPYLDAHEKAETLRNVVDVAKGGNMVAGSVQPLLATLGLTTMEGVKRINSTELQQVQGAGSLLERIKGAVRGLKDGDPLSPKIQGDIAQLADVLERGAYQKYSTAHDRTTKRYKLTDEEKLPAPASAASSSSGNGNAGGANTAAMQKPIPGIPGGIAESTDGGKTWKRVK